MAVEPSPVVPGSAIGIIANPMSGRDIRRLVSQASVFPNTEKTSMVLRIIRAAGALGVERVLMSTDSFGIAAGVLREVRRLSGAASTAHIRWPEIDFLTLDRPRGTAADTTAYAERMAQRCSAAVVLLGGDGTMAGRRAWAGRRPDARAEHRHQQRVPGDDGGYGGRNGARVDRDRQGGPADRAGEAATRRGNARRRAPGSRGRPR